MSSGTPDYFRTVRENYGSADAHRDYKVVTANDYTTLVNIIGKGIIYGGYLYLQAAGTQKNCDVALYVDDEYVFGDTFERLNKYGIIEAMECSVVLGTYDEVNYIYSLIFGKGITFERQFIVKYGEAHGETPNVFTSLMYALI
ncbi:MAG TPA: hypothetical protein VMY06_03220 [Sedimentisphaerales bacterium]|nr:hypothetical protein [Sedimentisphaerales bacterium]